MYRANGCLVVRPLGAICPGSCARYPRSLRLAAVLPRLVQDPTRGLITNWAATGCCSASGTSSLTVTPSTAEDPGDLQQRQCRLGLPGSQLRPQRLQGPDRPSALQHDRGCLPADLLRGGQGQRRHPLERLPLAAREPFLPAPPPVPEPGGASLDRLLFLSRRRVRKPVRVWCRGAARPRLRQRCRREGAIERGNRQGVGYPSKDGLEGGFPV